MHLLLTFLGFVVSVACACASVRRLWIAAELTALEPGAVLAAVRASGQEGAARVWSALRAEIASEPKADWERDLLEALRLSGTARVALVNEQLGELDHRAQRWARVPRVCASASTSFGFLLAALAMRAGLGGGSVDVGSAVTGAINAIALGIAGTAFCIAAQARARTMVRERLAAMDRLVERLEGLR